VVDLPPTPFVEWTDGTRWYEIAPGELRVYAAGVDLADRDREERAFFTTHATCSLSDLDRAVGYPERLLLTLEWERSWLTRLVYWLLPVPERPTRLRFPDRETYERVTDALAEAAKTARRPPT
jgi:hypothetical protein